MQRRDLLKSMVAACLSSAVPNIALSTSALAWKNWSGNQRCVPSARIAPQNLADLQTWLRNNQGKMRSVGSGHSFTALVPTDHTLISTSYIRGVTQAVDKIMQADIAAGTQLSSVGPALNEMGQAMINMPDVDRQTLAGAISTATHGTGRALQCLSAYTTEIELLTAKGELLTCNNDTNHDVFKAAQVGLGTIGLITRIRMQNREPFKLRRLARWHKYEEGLAQAEAFSKAHRNFEFYVIPFTGMILSDALDETDEAVTAREEFDGNNGLMDLKLARDYLGWSNEFRELVLGTYMKTLSDETNIDHSHQIYATERNVRFNEMEYHLPVENGLKALDEIKRLIESQFQQVFFPFECRFVKADDCWLSPFYKRDSISIAVHRYFEEDHSPLFAAIEPIFQKYGGRPHWGKLNTFTPEQCANAYERWEDFKQVRQALDPDDQLLNPYLKTMLKA
ncbi:FAD-binding protein [Oleiphilus sp. HI0009]|nr:MULTISPECIES: D-arabinono-1,4-lactone oxidase [unclassified Oleiphilus]KZX79450.1 FAD-binding protein [Oleiphilus sp. HI0009]KZY64420.1 FAD-binding protein [Oleiphilus sp. HI0066]KZY69361.1 FAD-binding protein [Oleiphilus sp. HI0067]